MKGMAPAPRPLFSVKCSLTGAGRGMVGIVTLPPPGPGARGAGGWRAVRTPMMCSHQSPAPRPGRRRKWLWIAPLCLVALTGLGTLGWIFLRSPITEYARFPLQANEPREVCLSPDGETLIRSCTDG